jgi:hypothetical protein
MLVISLTDNGDAGEPDQISVWRVLDAYRHRERIARRLLPQHRRCRHRGHAQVRLLVCVYVYVYVYVYV